MTGGSSSERPIHICVFGASGAIGNRLVQTLSQEGYAVTAVVRTLHKAVRLSRFPVALKVGDLLHSSQHEISQLVVGHDVVIDCTYSLAGDSQTAIDESVLMTQKLLKAARDADISSIVHYGTISVYPADANKIHEELECEYQGSAYGDGKLAAEKLYLKDHGEISVVVLQLPIVLGPFMGWTKNIAAHLTNGTLTLPNDLSGWCDTVHVDDVIHATLLSINKMNSSSVPIRERCLITNPKSVQWIDVYKLFADIMDLSSFQLVSRSEFTSLFEEQVHRERAWVRLKRTFERDGNFRQLVLAQWGIRTAYRLVKRFRGQAGMDGIKHRISSSLPAEPAAENILLAPHLVALYDNMPFIESNKASDWLGFVSDFTYKDIVQDSVDWLHWAGLSASND